MKINITLNSLFFILFGFFFTLGQVYTSLYTHWYILSPVLSIFIIYFFIKNVFFIDRLVCIYVLSICFSFIVFFYYLALNQYLIINYSVIKSILINLVILIFLSNLKNFAYKKMLVGIFYGYFFNIFYGISQLLKFDYLFFFISRKGTILDGRMSLTYPEPSSAGCFILLMQILFIFLYEKNLLSRKKYILLSFINVLVVFLIGSKAALIILAFIIIFYFKNIFMTLLFIFCSFLIIINYKLLLGIPAISQMYRLIFYFSNINDIFYSADSIVVRLLAPIAGLKNLVYFPFGSSALNTLYAFQIAFQNLNIDYYSRELTSYIDEMSNSSFKNYFLNSYYYFGPLILLFYYKIFSLLKNSFNNGKAIILILVLMACILELFNYLIWFSFLYYFIRSVNENSIHNRA